MSYKPSSSEFWSHCKVSSMIFLESMWWPSDKKLAIVWTMYQWFHLTKMLRHRWLDVMLLEFRLFWFQKKLVYLSSLSKTRKQIHIILKNQLAVFPSVRHPGWVGRLVETWFKSFTWSKQYFQGRTETFLVLRIKFSVVEESEYWMNVLTWSDLCEMCLHRKFVNIITNPALTHFTWTFNKYLDLTQPRPIAIMMQMIAWWEVLWHILLLRSLTNTCLSLTWHGLFWECGI